MIHEGARVGTQHPGMPLRVMQGGEAGGGRDRNPDGRYRRKYSNQQAKHK